MKKRFMIGIFLLFLILLVTGCNQEATPDNNIEKTESLFNEKDKEKAIVMIEDLNEKLVLFENETNEAISKGEIDVGNNEVFMQEVDIMSENIVIQPFLEKFPKSLISERGVLSVTYTPKSTDNCTFGNCSYDSIVVPTLELNEEEWETYSSEEFEITELILSNVVMSYLNKPDSGSTNIRFVKGTSDEIFFSFNPIIKSLNFNLKEWDEEFQSIKSNVPESEVEVEEEDFKQEVEEVLAKYPPLQ